MNYAENLEEKRKEIAEKTLKGEFWGPNGALQLAKGFYEPREEFSQLSSTYYAASGNCFARARMIAGPASAKKRLHGLWLLFKALRTSRRLVKAKGFYSLSASELDVRATILCSARFTESAQKCLWRALDVIQPGDCENQALIRLTLAKLCASQGQHGEAAEHFVQAEKDFILLRPLTRVRFYKARLEYRIDKELYEEAKDDLAKAKALSERHQFFDQLAKLSPLEERLKKHVSRASPPR